MRAQRLLQRLFPDRRVERVAQARRWVYGIEEAPETFICRDCRYALVR